MALQKKWEALVALKPDIAIVPEAATPRLVDMSERLQATTSHAWVGPNEKKGLLATSFGPYKLTPLPRSPEERPDALAVEVSGARTPFVLLAVWARPPKYVEHLHDVLDTYDGLLRSREVVMAGDFNSNAIWDKKHGKRSHSELVRRLEGLGLTSVYHSWRGEPHGAEMQNTFFLHGHAHRPYHIDYTFVPLSWRSKIVGCSVGEAATWLQFSDHCPLTVDVAA